MVLPPENVIDLLDHGCRIDPEGLPDLQTDARDV
jgi:hypothetical protein